MAETIWEVSPGGVTKFYGNYDYYLEKSATLANSVAANHIISGTAPDDDLITAKERRRARAQARSAISGELNKAKKDVEKLENLLDEQSRKKAVIIAKLSSGEKVNFAKLNTELAALEKEIAQTEADWETRAMELEALRQQNAMINS